MVDVGDKDVTRRTAVAEGLIEMTRDAVDLVVQASGPKGNVLGTAELSGVLAAKKTSDLIPMCHQIGLDKVSVVAEVDESLPGVRVTATARATARTGVEMEALTAVSVALLTIYDMVKSTGHRMTIREVRLLKKTGGKRGDWEFSPAQASTGDR